MSIQSFITVNDHMNSTLNSEKKIKIFEPNQDLKLLQKENHLVKIKVFLLCELSVVFMLVLSYFLKIIIAGFELYEAPQENKARRFVP